MKPEYYFCYIGPTDRNELDKKYPNGEGHIKRAINEAFRSVTGHWADVCGSGWGVTHEQTCHISFAADDNELKKAIVQSYLDEKKKMPDYVEAWYLLLKKRKQI